MVGVWWGHLQPWVTDRIDIFEISKIDSIFDSILTQFLQKNVEKSIQNLEKQLKSIRSDSRHGPEQFTSNPGRAGTVGSREHPIQSINLYFWCILYHFRTNWSQNKMFSQNVGELFSKMQKANPFRFFSNHTYDVSTLWEKSDIDCR